MKKLFVINGKLVMATSLQEALIELRAIEKRII